MKKKQRPSYLNFDKASYAWKPDVDYRRHPELYKVGKGEQGVLICEPYKSELNEHWRFRTPGIAKVSSAAIYKMFRAYLKADDFVGADMARKFLQMGYTRAGVTQTTGVKKIQQRAGLQTERERHRRSRKGRKCPNLLRVLEEG